MAQAQDVTLPQQGTDPVVLDLGGLPPTDDMLRVFVQGAETPLAGQYSVTEDTLLFTPAFGFEIGQEYAARILSDGEKAEIAFRLPGTNQTVPATVTEIYPSGDVLPENTLRFYIHFSTPMQPHVAFDYIRLVDASGVADDAAFMRFRQELWNEDRTRLTLLIDPGRIKREVATNLELGPALLAGESYSLRVDGGFPAADGASELVAFSQTFQVSDALRLLPDTRQWSTNAPCWGTRDPLILTFDRPFDRHLLTRALRVLGASGEEVQGTAEVENAEHAWSFAPHEPWPDEELRLVVDPTLEDVAGNNFQDLLDHVAGTQNPDTKATQLSISTAECPE